MYQVLLEVGSGELSLSDVPPPSIAPGCVLIRTRASLISAGTERYVIDLASKNLLGKAKARPDQARMVIEKAHKGGIRTTLRAVSDRLSRPFALGYSAAGVVLEVADDVKEFRPGDRVAAAGQDHASHAEINLVPKNLVVRLPDDVTFEQGAYTSVAAIGLQGVRLADPAIGEKQAIIGLGLVGLISAQILKANGCRVVGVDPSPSRRQLGVEIGLEGAFSPSEARAALDAFTNGRGTDQTIIAAATRSNETVVTAGDITRRRGSVIVVGAVGMDIPRETYFAKELRFQVSHSLGPGRKDPTYEQVGRDYPFDYVRWTEQRNMGAITSLVGRGLLDVDRLTTHSFAIEEALDAFKLVRSAETGAIGIILRYPEDSELNRTVVSVAPSRKPKQGELGVSFIGAGNYAATMLLPAVQSSSGVRLKGLVTATGGRASQLGTRYSFQHHGTDAEAVFGDDSTDLVIIATRHSTHAELARRALESGKHVFVEKPMATTPEQLKTLSDALTESTGSLMVGVNRRFAPMIRTVKSTLGNGPTQIVYRVNSGPIPPDSWTHLEAEGGGMLVGEMIHFVDVMQFLSGSRPTSVYARALRLESHTSDDHDNIVVSISFQNGSVGVLAYNTVGDKAAPKERIEVFGSGAACVIDDFRRLTLTRRGKTTKRKSIETDKGQQAMIAALLQSVRGSGDSPIPPAELFDGMQAIFATRESLRQGTPIAL